MAELWAGVTGLELGIGAALLIAGVGLGTWLRRGGRATRERIRELEAEVVEVRGTLEARQEAVAKHFSQTSDLFRDLTRQYTSLYSHLAEGARELCPDDVPELGQGFAGSLTESALTDGASKIALDDDASKHEEAP